MTTCIDCGNPWGVILEKGELPSDEAQRSAQLEMQEELADHIAYDYEDGVQFEFSSFPQVEVTEVFWLSRSTCDFISEHLNGGVPEGPCWVTRDGCDVPSWVLKSRKRRWAYRWECCSIDLSKVTVLTKDVLV
jgi:hypothetical protein